MVHFSTSQDYEDSSSDGDTVLIPNSHNWVFHDLTTRSRNQKLRNLLRFLGKSKYNFKDYKDTIKYGSSKYNYDYNYNDQPETQDNTKKSGLIKSFYDSMSSWFKKHKHSFKKWIKSKTEKEGTVENRRYNRNKK